MAKSKFDITPDTIEEIKALAGHGLSLDDIQDYFGIKKSCWYEKIKQFPEITDIIKQSRAQRGARAARKLWEYIEDGGKLGLTALMFYLKTQHRWRENHKDEPEQHQEPQQLNYTLQTTNPTEASRIYQKIMEAK
jgi:hypothetical protein